MWSIIATVVIALVSLLQGNILFMLFVMVAEAIILLLGSQKPKLMLYAANEAKVSIEGYREYPYGELKGFTLIEDTINSRYHELALTPVSRVSTHIKILVPAERVTDVKALISKYLPEVAYEESLSENILKRIGL